MLRKDFLHKQASLNLFYKDPVLNNCKHQDRIRELKIWEKSRMMSKVLFAISFNPENSMT